MNTITGQIDGRDITVPLPDMAIIKAEEYELDEYRPAKEDETDYDSSTCSPCSVSYDHPYSSWILKKIKKIKKIEKPEKAGGIERCEVKLLSEYADDTYLGYQRKDTEFTLATAPSDKDLIGFEYENYTFIVSAIIMYEDKWGRLVEYASKVHLKNDTMNKITEVHPIAVWFRG